VKTTIEWLRELVDFDLSPEELAERLTLAGLETEGIETREGETVLELETTSNRPDHLGAIGIAREISWICDSPLRAPETSYPTIASHRGKRLADLVHVEVHDRERCPRYIARLAVDVAVGPSAPWLRRRIEAIGLRSVNNVVDLSNYVLFEMGQPLHAFDFERISGGTIIVRRAALSESLTAIHGRELPLDREDLVIADAERAVALAGIMGGLESEVGESTTQILLESAWFEPVPVRRTSRRLALASDSSYRFERRVDPLAVDIASRRFLSLLARETGAAILEGEVEVCDPGLIANARRFVPLRPARVRQLLGVEIPAEELRAGLVRLGFEERSGGPPSARAERLEFLVPSFRADVTREIDLIEEAARVHGLDRIPEGDLSVMPVAERPEARHLDRIARLLIGAGYHDALTFAFTTEEDSAIEEWWSAPAPFEVRNPVRSAERRLRRSLLPRLWQAVRGNRLHGVEEARLFELARVFHRRPGSAAPLEREHIAWCASAAGEDYRSARGVADAVLALLGVEGASWTPLDGGAGGLAPGRAAQLHIGGERVGLVGAAQLDGVPGEVWGGELHLGPLLAIARGEVAFREFSRQPGVRRDLNVVVGEALTWRELAEAVRTLSLAHLRELAFGDIYRGKQVPAGRKSVLFSLFFQAEERSLTGEEVDAEVDRLVRHLGSSFGGELRK